MNPTAEDILNKHATGWTSAQKFWKRQIIAAMEEYSLIKSKDAASEAWDSGDHHGRNIGYYEGIDSNDERQQTRPDSKETYMKKYD